MYTIEKILAGDSKELRKKAYALLEEHTGTWVITEGLDNEFIQATLSAKDAFWCPYDNNIDIKLAWNFGVELNICGKQRYFKAVILAVTEAIEHYNAFKAKNPKFNLRDKVINKEG